MAFLLAFKNIVSRKSSYAIILFIAFSVSLLVVSNAFFDGTGKGIEKTFVQSFTGDLVIRPKVNFPLSLLGDETPATGSFSEIPQLVPYSKIFALVTDTAGDKTEIMFPQLSAQTVLNTNGNHLACVVFGVDAEKYLDVMDGITLVEGTPYSSEEKGILMSRAMIQKLLDTTGHQYQVGDTVQLLSGNGISYSLRAVTLTGIYEYKVRNEVLDRIALISPAVLRELTGISATTEDAADIDESQNDLISDMGSEDFDFDDLFGETSDFFMEDFEDGIPNQVRDDGDQVRDDGDQVRDDGNLVRDDGDQVRDATDLLRHAELDSASSYKEILRQAQDDSEHSSVILSGGEAAVEESHITSWSYLVLKLKDGVSPKKTAAALNRQFKKAGYEVQAVTWRSAAGLSAMYLYWIHNIFTIGILVLLGVGFIIVNNTLTVSALDRIHETGTLRAVGADRRFIILQFMSETFMLTITAGIIGCLLGVLWNYLLNGMHITFTNTYLIQLFGGSVLQTEITVWNFCKCMLLSVVLGFIGWIVPVKISMEVSPVQAMQRSL